MLTLTQVKQNIEAMEKQGASPADIQGYLDSLNGKIAKDSPVAPAPISQPTIGETQTKIIPGNNMFSKIGNALISSEQKFGKSIADSLPAFVPGSAAWTNKENTKLMASSQQITDNLLKTIKEKKARGEDTTRLEAALQQQMKDSGKPPIDINEVNASVNKTAKQVFGEGLGVFTDIATAGTYGNAAKGAQTGKLLVAGKASGKAAGFLGKAGIKSTIAPVAGKATPNIIGLASKEATKSYPKAIAMGALRGAAKAAPMGAAAGAGQGFSRALQDDKDLGEATLDAAQGAIVGGVAAGAVGGVTGGLSGWNNRRIEIKDGLKNAFIPDDQIDDALVQVERKTTGMKEMLKKAASEGDDDAKTMLEQIFKKNGTYVSEEAANRVDDIAADLNARKPGLGDKFKASIDINDVTPEELGIKAQDAVNSFKKIDPDVIQYKVVNGKKTTDEAAIDAVKKGFDEKDVAFVKNLSAEDKAIARKAASIAKAGANDKTFARQSLEESGKVVVDQAKTLQKAKQQIGQQLGALRVQLADVPVDLTKTSSTFMQDLAEAGVQVTDEGLDFANSRYANVPDVQKAIATAYGRVSSAGQNTTAKTADIIRQQLGTEVDLSAMSGTMDKSAKRILQRLYANLGDNLTSIDPNYAELSTKYSRLSDTLDDFQRSLGKDFKATDSLSGLKAGEVMRRMLGNASSNPVRIAEEMQTLARQYGYNPNVNVRNQLVFNQLLEDLLGSSQSQNLQSQLTKANLNAQEVVQTAADVATGNASGITSKVFKGLRLLRQVTPEDKLKALEALLN